MKILLLIFLLIQHLNISYAKQDSLSESTNSEASSSPAEPHFQRDAKDVAYSRRLLRSDTQSQAPIASQSLVPRPLRWSAPSNEQSFSRRLLRSDPSAVAYARRLLRSDPSSSVAYARRLLRSDPSAVAYARRLLRSDPYARRLLRSDPMTGAYSRRLIRSGAYSRRLLRSDDQTNLEETGEQHPFGLTVYKREINADPGMAFKRRLLKRESSQPGMDKRQSLIPFPRTGKRAELDQSHDLMPSQPELGMPVLQKMQTLGQPEDKTNQMLDDLYDIAWNPSVLDEDYSVMDGDHLDDTSNSDGLYQ